MNGNGVPITYRFNYVNHFTNGLFSVPSTNHVIITNHYVLLTISTTNGINSLLNSTISTLVHGNGTASFGLINVRPVLVSNNVPNLSATILTRIRVLIRFRLSNAVIGENLSVTLFICNYAVFFVDNVTLSNGAATRILLCRSTYFDHRSRTTFILTKGFISNLFRLTFHDNAIFNRVILVPLNIIRTDSVITINQILNVKVNLSASNSFIIATRHGLHRIQNINRSSFRAVTLIVTISTRILNKDINGVNFTRSTHGKRNLVRLPNSFLTIVTRGLRTVIRNNRFVNGNLQLTINSNGNNLVLSPDHLIVYAVFILTFSFVLTTIGNDLTGNDKGVSVDILAIDAFSSNRSSVTFNAVFAVFAVVDASNSTVLTILTFRKGAIFTVFTQLTVVTSSGNNTTLNFSDSFAILTIFTDRAQLTLLAGNRLIIRLSIMNRLTVLVLDNGRRVIFINTDVVTGDTLTDFNLYVVIVFIVISHGSYVLADHDHDAVSDVTSFLRLIFNDDTATSMD